MNSRKYQGRRRKKGCISLPTRVSTSASMIPLIAKVNRALPGTARLLWKNVQEHVAVFCWILKFFISLCKHFSFCNHNFSSQGVKKIKYYFGISDTNLCLIEQKFQCFTVKHSYFSIYNKFKIGVLLAFLDWVMAGCWYMVLPQMRLVSPRLCWPGIWPKLLSSW